MTDVDLALADAILLDNFRHLVEALASSPRDGESSDVPSPLVIRVLDALAQNPPPALDDDTQARLAHAIRFRYQNTPSGIPIEVSMALQLLDVLVGRRGLAWALRRAGPPATHGIQACKELLQSASGSRPDDEDVARALLLTIVSPSWRSYNPTVLVTVLRESTLAQKVDWQGVVKGFDRDGLQVDEDRFLSLYNALLPAAIDDAGFDLQSLWGGEWRNSDTHLSFLAAFVRSHPDRLALATVPRLRYAFTIADFEDAPDDGKELAAKVINRPLVSLDAVAALFDLVLRTSDTWANPAGHRLLQEIGQTNGDVFVCAAMGVPKPWTEMQHDIVTGMFYPFLLKQHATYDLVLHCAWKRDKQWVATRLVEAHAQDPMQLPMLLDHAQKHRWLKELVTLLNGLGLDLAALAHRRGILDIGQWAYANAERDRDEFAKAISRFIQIKAEDELKTMRKEQTAPRTISLAVRTVRALSQILEELLPEERVDELAVVQRLTIQVYPRLINYGQGFDDIIDTNDELSKTFPDSVDEMMREHYKAMYGNERHVSDIVEALRTYKYSQDPTSQDLFACMIHGLYDEYSCYQDYPLDALATTAVLFGGIIKCGLVGGVPLRVALGMVLEALRDFEPGSSMFKFGLQALLHFCNRLHEWPPYASCLLQIPGLEGTDAYRIADEAASKAAEQLGTEDLVDGLADQNGLTDGIPTTNGHIPDQLTQGSSLPPLNSIYVDPPASTDYFEDPSEEIQDGVLFALNNISEQNLSLKMQDLTEHLHDKHFEWFAAYLVEERAKVQPNFHKLYLDMLNHFSSRGLWDEVLRHTYVSVIRMLNAQSTLESSVERSYLKNLAGWLGSLTLARDKPVRFKNISFKDLLVEAYDTQRLIIAIPFTCKVLAQASKSIVFKPPNPWLMEIVGLLIELYHFAELRLQLKFEIEVVCKDLGLDHRAVEPSFSLRDRPRPDEELSGSTLPDGLDAFEDLSFPGIGRVSARSQRFSPNAMTAALPDISSMLVYPPTSNTSINRETLRYIVENAVRKAIQEIISPVVERSVGIAAIATAQLVHKDFAMESNEDRVRQSAYTMVKALAGSLALVTCKEPLRMSMTNNIRVLSAEVDEQALPEGAILMCVNDNLDMACGMVESAAEQRAMPEIEEIIEEQLVARRRHRAERGSEPFVDPIVNRWAFYIPEPYKQSPNGLNKEQLAIYEAFARQTHVAPSHEKTSSTDSGRQTASDVLQDQFPAIPHLPTPAEPPALPYDAPQQQQQQQQLQRPQPPQLVPSQLNGFAQPKTIGDQIQDYLFDLQRATKETVAHHLSELPPTNPVFEIYQRLLRFIVMSPHRDQLALATAKQTYDSLFAHTERIVEVEILVQLLKELCDLVAVTARELTIWFTKLEEEPAFNVQATVGLLGAGLLDLHRVDVMTTKALQQHNPGALEFLVGLMSETVFIDRPTAMRADFAGSLEVVEQWLVQDPSITPAQQLVQRLRESGIPEVVDRGPDQQSLLRRRQIEYTFSEWTRLYHRTGTVEKASASFIAQIHDQGLLNGQEESCLFLRICLEMAVDAYEETRDETQTSFGDSYIYLDSLAKLIVYLVKFREQTSESQHSSKAAYLDSILSLMVLLLNHHHVMRGDAFNQRAFFRLFSSFLCELETLHRHFVDHEKEIMLVIGKTFMALQPTHFPGFAYGWLSLVSHRYFLPFMLLLPDQTVCRAILFGM